jgi:hypothetical protein
LRRAVCTVALATAVCAVGAAGAGAGAGRSAGDGGGLMVDRPAVAPGTVAAVRGAHAVPGAIVAIHFADAQAALVTTTAGNDGRFAATFEVPETAGTGWHPVTAVSRGATLATTEIRVVGPDDPAAAGGVGAPAGLLLSTALLGLSVALAAGLRRHRGRSPTEPASWRAAGRHASKGGA